MIVHQGGSAIPDKIQVRGARVHNLKSIDVDVPLDQIVVIAGMSGSGKSPLALGVLYAEGSRRYLEALSTYTWRRMTQAPKAQVDEVLYVPAALAPHQRPGVPGIRSTFGTGTELLNSLQLMYSRLAIHRCPNGHYLPPTLAVAAEQPIICPECGAQVLAPSAEELAFNSKGACPACGGTRLSEPARAPRLWAFPWIKPAKCPYLTLGEETPSLSGGEAQRLKLASEMGWAQSDSVFVFDEPTIGLHPPDVQTLLGVFQTLIEHGATVVVIEHDLDVIRNADYLIDMGPGGGEVGGRVVAAGTPEAVAEDPNSVTGRYLK